MFIIVENLNSFPYTYKIHLIFWFTTTAVRTTFFRGLSRINVNFAVRVVIRGFKKPLVAMYKFVCVCVYIFLLQRYSIELLITIIVVVVVYWQCKPSREFRFPKNNAVVVFHCNSIPTGHSSYLVKTGRARTPLQKLSVCLFPFFPTRHPVVERRCMAAGERYFLPRCRCRRVCYGVSSNAVYGVSCRGLLTKTHCLRVVSINRGFLLYI